MNIRYLEILEAIDKAKTFTGAAKHLHLTQSAVSHAVAELEQEANTVLFERLPRGVRLTPCGETLLAEARAVLSACRSLDRRISHLEAHTPVSIVSSITIASFVLPKILSRVKAAYPDLQVNVRVTSAHAAMETLQSGNADIAFWEGAEPQGPFRTIYLGSYKLRAACAPSFPLSGQSLSPRQLCALPLLLREQGSAIRDTFDSFLSLAGQRAAPIWESVNSLALVKAAQAGLGITVLPETLLSDALRLHKLRLIEIEGADMENKMLAVLQTDKYITGPLQIILDALTGGI